MKFDSSSTSTFEYSDSSSLMDHATFWIYLENLKGKCHGKRERGSKQLRENYATSRWCLNELVKIMECKKEEKGQIVIPIFYNVDPSHVRHQRESLAKAFAKHETKYKDDVEGMEKVQRWRTALTAAADLKGYDISQG
ncbi:hypothetical protein RDI58_014676 [Solanum bulbocastanum]|uniref:TIR domain-containing protein n=1 Tax=Solanum bulbocastanum TaxID=147425 RepID=A0AAN8TIN7_SOLBU